MAENGAQGGVERGREVPLYDQFGERYDLMVEWSGRIARESPFLEEVFRDSGARRVLDLGCATGHHAARFAELGLETVGVDPSGEMLRIARERFGGLRGLSFVQAGFGELSSAVGGRFDVVTCLGNTIPHLPDDSALRSTLSDVAAVLRPGGRLVVQLLNYDRILASQQRFLGLGSRREGDRELLFFRFYDLPSALGASSERVAEGEGPITFNMATFERVGEGSWSYRIDATRLLPITSRQLADALAATGLEVERMLGDYSGQPFDPATSNDVVLVAARH